MRKWGVRTYETVLPFCQALLHRAAKGRPLGILKYAMTLDGKIATSKGHSAWVSSSASRQRVFEVTSYLFLFSCCFQAYQIVFVAVERWTLTASGPHPLQTRRQESCCPCDVTRWKRLQLYDGLLRFLVRVLTRLLLNESDEHFEKIPCGFCSLCWCTIKYCVHKIE